MSARTLEFLIPGDLQSLTGGYGYDRRIIAGLSDLGWRIGVHTLSEEFPEPSAAALEHAHHVLTHLPLHSLVLLDGLAAGAMPQLLREHASRLRLVALVHHPLAAENGLAEFLVRQLAQSERQALEAVHHVIVTSRATQSALHDFGVESHRVSVVEPGTDAAPPAPRLRGATLKMLCVATLTPRKGHDVLFAALGTLTSERWQLTCVGSLARSPETVKRLRAQLRDLGLDHKVVLVGDQDATQLARAYQDSDLFVLPTRLEGYGMAVAEALAYGLPVVSTPVGAIPELVGASAGILVPPDDAHALGAALDRLLNEPSALAGLSTGALAVRARLPRWEQSCERMAGVLDAVRG